MSIGKKIKYYRELNNITQKELARKIGIGVASIQRYEREETKPPIDIILELASVLKIGVSDLILVNVSAPMTKIIEKPLSEYSTKELLEELLRRNYK